MNGVTHGLRNVVLRLANRRPDPRNYGPAGKSPDTGFYSEVTYDAAPPGLPLDTLVMKGDAKRSLNYDNAVLRSPR